MFLGEGLPDSKTLIHNEQPDVRIEQFRQSIELLLDILSMKFGFGTKRYSFQNGQVQTATEYIGERQDMMQELNKQRAESRQYIDGIVRAVLWFSNTFNGTSFPLDGEINIEFDDSYVEDKQTKLESMRADAVTFQDIPWLTFMYIKTKYNLSDEEAQKYINEGKVTESDDFED